jgi:REP element-mobilizing transposase RayT
MEGCNMPQRGHAFAQGHYYHVYNRGVARQKIFFAARNYEHFRRLMIRYYRPYGAAIIAYCLMPNHFHFLLRQETDRALSSFVGVVCNAYAQAINKQQQRSGPLFEGRFRHIWIDREEYLVHLCRYIHLNPVRAGLVTSPELWAYSNYLEWINQRSEELQDSAFILSYFPNADMYITFMTDQIDERHKQQMIEQYIWEE